MNSKVFLYAVSLYLVSLMFFGSFAFAVSLPNMNQTIVNAEMSQVTCRTTFTVSYLNQVVSIVPSTASTLNPLVSTTQQYTSQLQSLASSDNLPGFRSYLTGTYNPEISTIHSAMESSLKAANVSQATLQTLRSDYNNTKASYETCAFTSLKSFANIKVTTYQNDLAQYQQTITKMNAKGVSTTALTQELNGATSTIINPLQSGINSASNSSQLRSAVNAYCMFDGCQNGINYHLAANFQAQTLQAIITKAKTLNLTSTQQSNLNTAQGYVSTATSTLQVVGTSPYTTAQTSTVWGNIKNASVLLKSILSNK